jgi:hypothetical protein
LAPGFFFGGVQLMKGNLKQVEAVANAAGFCFCLSSGGFDGRVILGSI